MAPVASRASRGENPGLANGLGARPVVVLVPWPGGKTSARLVASLAARLAAVTRALARLVVVPGDVVLASLVARPRLRALRIGWSCRKDCKGSGIRA